MKKYQVAIIGGGPAGYTAAEKAGKAGLSVILFEKRALGGVCLNDGCIPTKTLLYSAKLYDTFKEAKRFALECTDFTYDFKKIISRKNKVVRKLVLGIKAKMQEAGVTVIEGEAQLKDKNTIICNDESYTFDNLIICTGSETFVPPIKGIENIDYWTHEEALSTKEQPKSLIIVGGGVIGMEFASFYNSLGTEVTVVEMMDEILSVMDAETVQILRDEYTKRGIKFMTSTQVMSFGKSGELLNATVVFEGEEQFIEAEKILISVGRRAMLDKLVSPIGLELNERKQAIVSDKLQSNIPHVYVCGDANGKSLLAHTAIREAEVAVNTILGMTDTMSYQAIPSIVYTNPELAAVGHTEAYLIKHKVSYTKKTLPMTFSGRFVAENEGFSGLVKILIDTKTKHILGVHIVGNPASEIITLAAMAIENKLTVDQWNKIVFPHPTVCEIFKDLL